MQESQYVTSFDGTRIAYRVYGKGSPTIVLCNGLTCNQVWMEGIIAEFSPRHRIVIWDYRGHVDSAIPAEPRMATVDACMQDLSAVLEATNTKKAIFLGFSMGVQVCLEFYGRHPEKALGLILMSGTYQHTLKTFSWVGPLLDIGEPVTRNVVRFLPWTSSLVWKIILTGPWNFVLSRIFIFNWSAMPREPFDRVIPHMAELNLRNFTLLAQSINNHSAVSVLPRLKVPTLIICGDQDTFTPKTTAEEMHALAPNSELHIVPGGSHAGILEFADEFVGRIRAFVDKHFAKSARKSAKKQPVKLRAVS